MSDDNFQRAKKNSHSSSDNAVPGQPKPCAFCFKLTKHENLITYGARCYSCYESYRGQPSPYIWQSDKYAGDPKAWARRIIDRAAAGETIIPISLRFARQALKLEVQA